MLVDHVTIAQSAGAPAMLVAFGVAAVLAVPSLVVLFWLVDRGMVSGGEDRPDPAPG